MPDLLVVLGTPRQIARHPATGLLLIEIADTTLEFDRNEKAQLYAQNLLADYWILNLNTRCLEVHRRPARDSSGTWKYQDIQTFGENDSISPLSAQGAAIKVSDILP